MKLCTSAAMLLLLASAVLAGWNDQRFSSPQSFQDFHQGRPINITLNVSNLNKTDGYATYIANVTLHPPSCINNGTDITVVGAILCTSADPNCRTRYHTAPDSYMFNFTNLSTNSGCANGLAPYSFTLDGNTEYIGYTNVWSPDARQTNTSADYLRFIGADSCGDRTCAPVVESCSTCEADCGRCPECSGSERVCRNSSILECVNGFFNRTITQCSNGCETTGGVTACRRTCPTNGEARCADDNRTLQTCVEGDWRNETCVRLCANNACATDLCTGVACPDKCEAGTAYAHGACNPESGNCTYFTVLPCPNGCEGDICRSSPLTPLPTNTPPPTTSCCGAAGLVLLGILLLARRA